MSARELGFFTVSAGGHNWYTAPFILSALLTHGDAMAEVIVSERDLAGDDLAALQQLFGDRLILRSVPERYRKWRKIPKDKRSMIGGELYAGRFPFGSIRWLEVPQMPVRFVYISDDDILNTNYDIVEQHLVVMEKIGRPYSNIVRADMGPAMQKLSGLLFADKARFYTDTYATVQQQYFERLDRGDFTWYCERLLYRLVLETHGLPPPQYTGWQRLRPIHGVHLACTRPETNWNVNMRTVREYRDLDRNPIWQDFKARLFKPKALEMLARLDMFIAKERY